MFHKQIPWITVKHILKLMEWKFFKNLHSLKVVVTLSFNKMWLNVPNQYFYELYNVYLHMFCSETVQ